MHTVKSILLLFAVLFNTTIYAEQNTKAADVYTEERLGISVTKDKPQFVIKLKSNPSTGYAWFLRDYDERLVTPIKHTFEAAKDKLVGSPGFELWTFRVKPAGFLVPQQTVIRLVSARPWEGIEQSKQIAFRITMVKQDSK